MMLGNETTSAQCPGTQPQFSEFANQDPAYLQLCYQLDSGGGCPTAPTPTVVTGTTLAQEVRLTAMVAAGFTADSVFWDAYTRTASGALEQISRQVSHPDPPLSGGTLTEYGVTGLVPDADHQFRVSFCGLLGCYCWSSLSAVVHTQSIGDLGLRPDPPPAPIVQRVADTFTRTATQPKFDPDTTTFPAVLVEGYGLGPDLIWLDFFTMGPTGNGSRIHSDEQSAFIPTNGSACWAPPAKHAHSYAEAVVSLPPGAANEYNFDVRTRVHIANGTEIRGYAAKLAYEYYNAPVNPKLYVVRAFGVNVDTICDLNLPVNPCSGPGTSECDCAPPLSEGQVWLRNEVQDSGTPERPEITAIAAWDCDSASGIETCGRVCRIDACRDTDQVKAELMVGVTGMRGIQAHEVPVLVRTFSAGSEPSCSDGACDPGEDCASCPADCGICP